MTYVTRACSLRRAGIDAFESQANPTSHSLGHDYDTYLGRTKSGLNLAKTRNISSAVLAALSLPSRRADTLASSPSTLTMDHRPNEPCVVQHQLTIQLHLRSTHLRVRTSELARAACHRKGQGWMHRQEILSASDHPSPVSEYTTA